MMYRRMLTLFCAGALVAGVLSPAARAQSPDKKSVFFTFSQSVTLPNVTLPAGRYLFQLADSQANRTIVQIYSADRSKLYGMMMTMPARRAEAPNDGEVRFMEAAANAPQPIASWWYPGERTGWEFIYPRSQAVTIAKTSSRPVLTTTTDANTPEAMRTAELTRIDRSGQQTAVGNDEAAFSASSQAARGELEGNDSAARSATVAQSTAAAPVTTPAPAAVSTRSATSASTPAADRSAARSADASATRAELPQTASPIPTIGLIGLAALAMAGLLRLRRRAV